MKKIVFTCIAILFSYGALMAQTSSTNTNGDKLISVNEETHDFGNVPQGKPVSFSFLAKNISNDNITLQSATASCGCTTPDFKAGVYKPGETFSVKVTYNAANPGDFQKTVTIIMNGDKIEVLHIKGTVVPSTDGPKTM